MTRQLSRNGSLETDTDVDWVQFLVIISSERKQDWTEGEEPDTG
jgi:hypothetical protein